MSVVQIDPNVWYTIQDATRQCYLGVTEFLTGGEDVVVTCQPRPQRWQLLDTGFMSGDSTSKSWLIRTEASPNRCLDGLDGFLSLDDCTTNTDPWQIVQTSDIWTLVRQSANVLTAQTQARNNPDKEFAYSTSYSTMADIQFRLAVAGIIDDPAWFTMPYRSSTDTLKYIPQIKSELNTVSTLEGVEHLIERADVTPTRIPLRARAVNNGPFSTSIIKRTVTTLGNPAAKIGCENCTMSGLTAITIGGYSAVLANDTATIEDFAKRGYINMALSGVEANIVLDISLPPDFTFASGWIPLAALFATFNITDLIAVQFVLDIGIYISITQGSNLTFGGGFNMSLPLANINIENGSPGDSTATGLEATNVQIQSYRVSSPDVAFTAETDFGFRLNALLDANSPGVTTNTSFFVMASTPSLILTAQAKTNVDDNCALSSTRTIHETAVELGGIANAQVYGQGELQVTYQDKLILDINAGQIPNSTFKINNATQCLYDGSTTLQYLAGSDSTGKSTGNLATDSRIWRLQTLSFLTAWLLAIII